MVRYAMARVYRRRQPPADDAAQWENYFCLASALVGAGWGLALACDLCFAAAGASFRLPEVPKGFRLPEPLAGRLVEVAGPVRAAEIMFGGQAYQAADALAAGWVTRVLPGGPELAAEAWRFASGLASAPRRAVAAAKQALRPGPGGGPFPPAQLGWTDE